MPRKQNEIRGKPITGHGCSDLKLCHDIFELNCQIGKSLSAELHLTAAFSHGIRLLIDSGNVTGDVGNNYSALSDIFITSAIP